MGNGTGGRRSNTLPTVSPLKAGKPVGRSLFLLIQPACIPRWLSAAYSARLPEHKSSLHYLPATWLSACLTGRVCKRTTMTAPVLFSWWSIKGEKGGRELQCTTKTATVTVRQAPSSRNHTGRDTSKTQHRWVGPQRKITEPPSGCSDADTRHELLNLFQA